MENYRLHSCFRGTVSGIFWTIIIFGGNYLLSWYWTEACLNSTDRHSFNYHIAENFGDKFHYIRYGWLALSAFAFFDDFYDMFSDFKFTVKDGTWKQYGWEKYSFPFSKNTGNVYFDRIVDVRVIQPTISRLFFTGSIEIKTVTFVSGDTIENEYYLHAVPYPRDVEAQLNELIAHHEGMDINIKSK